MKLNARWSFWFHDLNNNDWSNDSYQFLYAIQTTDELFNMLHLISENHLKKGMYFLMLNDIFPDWSDPRNSKGGCWSYKITKDYWKTWVQWIIYMVSEEIVSNSRIHGISFSPKQNHSILKLWNNDSSYHRVSLINRNLDTTGCKYCAFSHK